MPSSFNAPDAEAVVLAAMIADPSCIPSVFAQVGTPASFRSDGNCELAHSIERVYRQTQTVEAPLLVRDLIESGTLDAVGGPARIARMLDEFLSPATLPFYTRQVAESARKHALAATAEAIQHELGTLDAETVLARAHERLTMAASLSSGRAKIRLGDAVERAMERIRSGKPSVYRTGLYAFDFKFEGVPMSGVTTFIGRSSSGKTSLAAQFAMNIARQGVPVLVFSYEMEPEVIACNLLGNLSEVSVSMAMRLGDAPHKADYAKVRDAAAELASLQVEFVEQRMSAEQIVTQCAMFKAQRGHGVVLIDYIQSLDGAEMDGGINRAATQIQRIHRELGLCVLLVTQMDKFGGREDKMPTLLDARGGQQIEAVSTMGIGTYRECQYKPKEDGESEESWKTRQQRASIHVSKNKYGTTDTIDVRFIGSLNRFETWKEPDPERVEGDRADRVPATGRQDEIPF